MILLCKQRKCEGEVAQNKALRKSPEWPPEISQFEHLLKFLFHFVLEWKSEMQKLMMVNRIDSLITWTKSSYIDPVTSKTKASEAEPCGTSFWSVGYGVTTWLCTDETHTLNRTNNINTGPCPEDPCLLCILVFEENFSQLDWVSHEFELLLHATWDRFLAQFLFRRLWVHKASIVRCVFGSV